jgi:pimeloyl-ACP methyl ester carboxylesterase
MHTWPKLIAALTWRGIRNPATGVALLRVGWRFRSRDWYRRFPFVPLPAREYVRWRHQGGDRAERLCDTGVPTWIMHAEKGDGGLTDDERRTLDACPSARVITIPGSVFFLPNEIPERIAEVILEAASSAA